jgi:hypothetical protein
LFRAVAFDLKRASKRCVRSVASWRNDRCSWIIRFRAVALENSGKMGGAPNGRNPWKSAWNSERGKYENALSKASVAE